VDDDALPGGTGTSSRPFSLIQDGINAAANGDTVLVKDGMYRNTGNRDLNFFGKAITVKSLNGPENCVIDCQGTQADPHRAFYFHQGEGADSVVEAFTIRNGYAYGDWPQSTGGAMLCEGASPTIKDNTIEDNTAEADGGAIYCRNASPVISGNIIINNTVNDLLSGAGGAIYSGMNSSPVVSDNTLVGNFAPVAGGGITCRGSCVIFGNLISGNESGTSGGGLRCNGTTTAMNNTITENVSYWGGGIYCQDDNGIIMNNTITANQGAGIHCQYDAPAIEMNLISGNTGSGVFISDGAALIRGNLISGNGARGVGCVGSSSGSQIISHNIIMDNGGNGRGGGISCDGRIYRIIENNAIIGNSAQRGGGIHCNYIADPFQIRNNLIIANTASFDSQGYGGGIYCEDAGPYLENNTLANNEAYSAGGGIYCKDEAFPVIINSIFWSNQAPEGKEIYIGSEAFPAELTISYSDVEGGQSSVFVDVNCVLNWGPGMLDADPLFISGPLGGFYLEQQEAGQWHDSPCVDAGDEDIGRLPDIIWTGTTRTDFVKDAGFIDMGFHYPIAAFPAKRGSVNSPDSELKEAY
jgi:predicted outer membrane repeat protein